MLKKRIPPWLIKDFFEWEKWKAAGRNPYSHAERQAIYAIHRCISAGIKGTYRDKRWVLDRLAAEIKGLPPSPKGHIEECEQLRALVENFFQSEEK